MCCIPSPATRWGAPLPYRAPPCAAERRQLTPLPAAARLVVTHGEVEALHELYHKLSNELHKDDLIHKDEFMWALFKANRDNLFAERVGAWVGGWWLRLRLRLRLLLLGLDGVALLLHFAEM